MRKLAAVFTLTLALLLPAGVAGAHPPAGGPWPVPFGAGLDAATIPELQARMHAGERLIEKQDRGLQHQAATELQQLLLTARQVFRRQPLHVREREELEIADRVDERTVEPDLLLGLAQRRIERRLVGRIDLAARKGDLAGMLFEMRRALGQKHGRLGVIHHPTLTLTVADIDGFIRALR